MRYCYIVMKLLNCEPDPHLSWPKESRYLFLHHQWPPHRRGMVPDGTKPWKRCHFEIQHPALTWRQKNWCRWKGHPFSIHYVMGNYCRSILCKSLNIMGYDSFNKKRVPQDSWSIFSLRDPPNCSNCFSSQIREKGSHWKARRPRYKGSLVCWYFKQIQANPNLTIWLERKFSGMKDSV